MVKILVVEDDKNLNQIMVGYLTAKGYQAEGCFNGKEALLKLSDSHYDMVISDIMMPGMDGFELAKSIRATDEKLPLLFVTAREDLSSKQKGYDLGIDEYLVKPFDLDELVMRVKAVLRRANIESAKKLTIGNLVMDNEEHTAYVDGKDINLTVREFDILYKLLSYPKKPFTRAQLMDDFWSYDSNIATRTVDVYMTKIREKTQGCTGFELVTVHGLGYKAVLK